MGHKTVGLIVNLPDGCLVRRFHQAKGGRALLVEPVGQEPDAVLFLNGQVGVVGVGNRVFRCAFDKVSVHIDRHTPPPAAALLRRDKTKEECVFAPFASRHLCANLVSFYHEATL